MNARETIVIATALVILLLAVLREVRVNNACKDFTSYIFIYFSRNCYYIPDNGDSALGIIKRHTGVGESHQVKTEDGYILALFRIPRQNPKGVILLQHGLSHDSRYWLAQYNESVAFFFWNAGYDVWLGNHRGTTYSNKHINLTVAEETFWDFSLHELGYYDVPSTIDYIKNVTNVPKIIYVGLSVGATSGIFHASLRPEEAADSVKVMINLAPYYLAGVRRTTFKTLLGISNLALHYRLSKFLKWYTLFDHDSWYLKFLRFFSKILPFKMIIVNLGTQFIGGNPKEVDPNVYNLMVDQWGSATSLKAFAHFYQLDISEGKFQMYDHGEDENLKLYNTTQPPLYPLENIKVPLFILYGDVDKLSRPEDVEEFYWMLPEKSKTYGKLKISGYSHHDFLFGIHRNEKVYSKIIDFLNVLD